MDRIVICGRCGGYGQISYDVGSHKSEYKYKKCSECGGSGRLEMTTHIEHKPFVPDPDKSKRLH